LAVTTVRTILMNNFVVMAATAAALISLGSDKNSVSNNDVSYWNPPNSYFSSVLTTAKSREESNIPVEVEHYESSWKCPTCSSPEQRALAYLQEKTNITDKLALSTVMGNIKAESNFHANICEGGARVPYNKCHRGGYGLIQWTTQSRYDGLGSFCRKYGCDPSSLEGQLQYMVNENQFRRVLPHFQGRGHGISQYMRRAYSWIGWGIEGYRVDYAYNYARQLLWA